MANKEILQLAEDTGPVAADVVEIQKAGGGAGSSKYSQIGNLPFAGSRTPAEITDDYQLALGDQFAFLKVNKATAIEVEIPLNATAAIPVGSMVPGFQAGNGQVTIAFEVGVTVTYAETLLVRKIGSGFELWKIDTDEWYVAGDMEEA